MAAAMGSAPVLNKTAHTDNLKEIRLALSMTLFRISHVWLQTISNGTQLPHYGEFTGHLNFIRSFALANKATPKLIQDSAVQIGKTALAMINPTFVLTYKTSILSLIIQPCATIKDLVGHAATLTDLIAMSYLTSDSNLLGVAVEQLKAEGIDNLDIPEAQQKCENLLQILNFDAKAFLFLKPILQEMLQKTDNEKPKTPALPTARLDDVKSKAPAPQAANATASNARPPTAAAPAASLTKDDAKSKATTTTSA